MLLPRQLACRQGGKSDSDWSMTLLHCLQMDQQRGSFCAGFEGMVQAANRNEMGKRNGGSMLSAQSTERALLTNLLARLRTLDADVYVGHNISAFDLDVLLHRLQHHKVIIAAAWLMPTCTHAHAQHLLYKNE